MSRKEEQASVNSACEQLAAKRERQHWRSLEELCESEEFEALVKSEFPRQASQLGNALDRRSFIKLMGASLMLAGLSNCTFRPPDETIVPYDRQPEEIVLGKPLFYATAATLGGYALGLLVESHEGRPTKVEGNSAHPASLGATNIYAQASVLTLYDPDRSRTVLHHGEISTWSAFLTEVRRSLTKLRGQQGAGLRILTETITSPTLAAQFQSLIKDIPQAVWHSYEPCGRDQLREGARLAFGDYVETLFHFDRADVVLALDSDFLSSGAASIRHARDFMSKRKIEAGRSWMNRLYAVECTPSNTGAMADHRLPVKASEIENFARSLAAQLGVQLALQDINQQSAISGQQSARPQWMAALVRDLQAHRGASIIIAGDEQPPIVHALCHAMNQALGNVGSTVDYIEMIEASPANQLESLRQLVQAMDAGQVELLLVLGGNPVYSAPVDFHFAESLKKVGTRVHLSLYEDETSALCDWHVPEAHELEMWGDARAFDGTTSIIQPLIAPLYDGKSAIEMLAAFTDTPERNGYDILREYWLSKLGAAAQPGNESLRQGAMTKPTPNTQAKQTSSASVAASTNASSNTSTNNPTHSSSNPSASASTSNLEQMWHRALHDGYIANTAAPAKSVTLKPDWANQAAATADAKPSLSNSANANSTSNSTDSNGALEIVFRPDPSIHDGRFANNGWLQELPKPLTKLTWDNAAIVSPATAKRYALSSQLAAYGGEHGNIQVDVVELRYRGRSVRAPVWILPGQADDCVTLPLGYGRTRAGNVGNDKGFNAYLLRASDTLWFGDGLEIVKMNERYSLACTQAHHSMEGRDLVRSATLDDYRAHPDFARREADDPQKAISLYPEWKYEGYAWGMAIDTGSCIGCNACVVACQAENNIPIVGKEEVLRAREMHWLRIDRYYEGDESNPQTLHQPVLCQHCENAPCEVVCPVEATSHSDEGLNEMTYNRCVGTRYCSNNCPYKVRRFNFFEYADYETPVLKLQRNPNVTVRSRGVMEKCTYCVQRINAAKIEAENENREVRDGEIMTACQAVCPTEAIIFGNINDPQARVSRLKQEPRNYGLLAELNTRPRTTYLATVRNPNPEIEEKQSNTGKT